VRKLKGLLKVKDEKYVEHEMLLLMGNRFHLTVYHPFRSLLVRVCVVRWFRALLWCWPLTPGWAWRQGLLYRLRQVMVAAKRTWGLLGSFPPFCLSHSAHRVLSLCTVPNDRVRDVLKAAHARGNELCYQALVRCSCE